MFHHSRLIEVQQRVSKDLEYLEYSDSVKIYLCWYDEFLVSREDYNGVYPCSNKKVSLQEMLAVINVVFKKPCIVRHNVNGNPFPVILPEQSEEEKYIEVCIIKNLST
jgi:hypothetical protein